MSDFVFERNKDIHIRGEDRMVYDLDGYRVKLKNARVWFDDEGKYVPPRENCCLIM
tara:strand:- start:9060 stop:9227 length:168 start_codon:yes stop_codon:yes gene_type:complete